MAFQVSPGVNVSEIDLTTIVPAVSTTTGAIAGAFNWGPVGERRLISTESELVAVYGKPSSGNFETWLTAANFLGYANALQVVRSCNTSIYNSAAMANTEATGSSNVHIRNEDQYETLTLQDNVLWYAKYPGDGGNSLKISVCDSANAYTKEIDLSASSVTLDISQGSNRAYLSSANTSNIQNVVDDLAVNDIIEIGNTTLGFQTLKISNIGTVTTNTVITLTTRNNLSEDFSTSSTIDRYWEFYNEVDAAPGTTVYTENRGGTGDEIHVVVVDEDGQFSGVPGTIVEVWEGLSRASDARSEQGGTLYYKDVINQQSRYVWWANHRAGAGATTAATSTAATTDSAYTFSFGGGTTNPTESNVGLAELIKGYDLFRSAEDVDVSLVMAGPAKYGTRGMGLARYIIENVCEFRKDCIALISPQQSDVVNNTFQEDVDIVATRNQLPSSSYGVMDSGYKYQYDRYNDVYRWVPLNGDVAGLITRTDNLRDPWFSPAGLNRGSIKNVTKLAFNPSKADRDVLYKAGINPVVTFPGQGTILFGDKTLLSKPSAFDRINVRRLFIVLEKAIATASQFTLFEFNDAFTRAQFRNLVEPYLRDIQGRRGITDFRVVCDETNNTGEVIDRNEFIGDIYIKPARSINFIQLNFVAVRTGIAFEEVVGQF